MTRKVPMAPCLALLKAFDKDNPTPQQTIAVAAEVVETILGEGPAADLNDGQFAALIDFYLWKGEAVFTNSLICEWVRGGNFAKPVKDLPSYGPRGVAERDVWNVGNAG